ASESGGQLPKSNAGRARLLPSRVFSNDLPWQASTGRARLPPSRTFPMDSQWQVSAGRARLLPSRTFPMDSQWQVSAGRARLLPSRGQVLPRQIVNRALVRPILSPLYQTMADGIVPDVLPLGSVALRIT